MELFGFALAFIIGVVMGLIGAGGSILSSGLLVYIFGFNPIVSASYTLLNVGVISLIGSLQYYRQSLVNVTTGLWFALPAITTVLFMRSFVMPAIPPVLIEYNGLTLSKELLTMLVFAILMIVIALNMLSGKSPGEGSKFAPLKNAVVLSVGILVGLLTGFIGIGGGFIIVPALVLLTGLDMKSAIGTSLFIITLNTAVGFVSDFSSGVCYNWIFLTKYIAVTVAGMVTSGFIVKKIRTGLLKKIFALVILIAGCGIIVKELLLDQKLVDKNFIETTTPALQPQRTFLHFD